MKASGASSSLRKAARNVPAQRGIRNTIKVTMLLALATVLQAHADDVIEAPVSVEAVNESAASETGSWSARPQPGQSLIGRVDLVNAGPSYSPTVSLERSRLLPSGQEWPGSNGVDAYGRPYTEMAGLSYRWWMRRGRTDVGFGVGTMGYLLSPPEGVAAGARSPAYSGPITLALAAPTINVGMRYQVDERSTLFADALSARRATAESRSDLYSTKVGVEWKEARSRFGFDKGALGVQFDSGVRMSLRARKGGLGVYLRGQF